MQSPTIARSRGRPRRFAELENLRDNPPATPSKRPRYINGIGLLHGKRDITAYVKIRVPDMPAKELKLGLLSSFSWDDLEQRRRALQAKADRNEPLEDLKPVTFTEHAAQWLARKKHTVRGYGTLNGILTNHLLPTFGPLQLSRITVSDVNNWIASQRASELQPSTVARQLGTLSAILNDAVRVGLLAQNPAMKADRVRGVISRQRFLEVEDLGKVLAAARRIEDQEEQNRLKMPKQKRGWLSDFLLWAIHSGMRRQEILNLTLTDVAVTTNGASVCVKSGKSDRPRIISATPIMVDVYRRQKSRPRELGDDRLFLVSLTTLKRKLTELWRMLEVKDVRLHDLRRSHATALCRAGVDMRTVAGRLGHRDTKMLMNVYAVFGENEAATGQMSRALSAIN